MRSLALLALCWSPCWCVAQDLTGEEVYARCAGAVVQVSVEDALGRRKSAGSGVVLKDSAWLVTNNHIFERGGLLYADKDSDPLDLGTIVRSDKDLDVLIIRIIPETFPETWAKISDLEIGTFDALKPGQRVYTIGNPSGLDNSIADGVLSARRVDDRITRRLLQISAPISPGSSGGGVFDGRGRLIGVSTFIYGSELSQNLNFALAIDDVVEWDRAHTRHDIKAHEPHPQYVAGIAEWKAHDCEGAIAHFRLIPDDDGSKGDALYYTARCLHHAGDLKQAKEGYQRALAKDPRIARAHAFLAVILYHEGDVLGSFEHQNKAYELDPRLRDAKVAVDDW